MARSKVSALNERVSEAFPAAFDRAFFEKFGVKCTTTYNIFQMALTSSRDDDQPMTKAQKEWSQAYSEGYAAARDLVR